MPVRARLPLATARHALAAMKSISGDCGWRSITDEGRALYAQEGRAFSRVNNPSGKSVSSPVSKNISLRRLVETALWIPAVPPHSEGRLAIVTDGGKQARSPGTVSFPRSGRCTPARLQDQLGMLGPPDSKSTSSRATNHPQLGCLSLRHHAANDRQAACMKTVRVLSVADERYPLTK